MIGLPARFELPLFALLLSGLMSLLVSGVRAGCAILSAVAASPSPDPQASSAHRSLRSQVRLGGMAGSLAGGVVSCATHA